MLFRSESPEGFEEERRLFYVALTRAKVAAVLSYAEMRFKWGNTEFSRPSCFLKEIDPRYLESDFDDERPVRTQAADEGRTALDELRRRFDYRFQKGGSQSDTLQERRAQSPMFRRPQGVPTRQPQPSQPAPQPVRSVEGMRSVGVHRAGSTAAAAGAATGAVGCPYAVGDRVEHPKFGAGEVVRIETLATDHKVVVRFGDYGEKTLLAKFAKLTRL